MKLSRFLTATRFGRKLTKLIHRWPIHPGAPGLRFAEYGCWLCRLVTKPLMRELAKREPFPDETSIRVSDPIYAEDGTLLRHGVSMTATAARQLEAFMADPETAASVQKAIDDIAAHPEL